MSNFTRTLLFWTLILSACSPIITSTEAVPQNEPPVTQPLTSVTIATEQPPTSISIATTEVLPDSPTLPVTKFSQTLETPHIDQPPDAVTTPPPSNPQDCGYQWAYQDLPELSREFLQSIQTLQPGAQAVAFGLGENCVHADGSTTFLPMETDFNVTLQVVDLADEADLGGWIVKIMQIIESLPPEQIIGPRPGRVSVT